MERCVEEKGEVEGRVPVERGRRGLEQSENN